MGRSAIQALYSYVWTNAYILSSETGSALTVTREHLIFPPTPVQKE